MEVCGQRLALAALPPGKTRYPLYRKLGGPQGQSWWVRKISPPPAFDSRNVQRVAIPTTLSRAMPHATTYKVVRRMWRDTRYLTAGCCEVVCLPETKHRTSVQMENSRTVWQHTSNSSKGNTQINRKEWPVCRNTGQTLTITPLLLKEVISKVTHFNFTNLNIIPILFIQSVLCIKLQNIYFDQNISEKITLQNNNFMWLYLVLCLF